jgi:hypothetical protein
VSWNPLVPQRQAALTPRGIPTPFAFDGYTGLHLVRSIGAFSLPDGTDTDWLLEDPDCFVDIRDDDIDEIVRFTKCRWQGPSPQISAVLDGRCYGVGVAALKHFHDGTAAVNLTYAVRQEARGTRLGALLSSLATFELRQVLIARGGLGGRGGCQWPANGIVSVQTRTTNEASKRLALGMGLTPSPDHGFEARLRDGRRIEFAGFAGDLAAFQQRMAPELAQRVALSDENDPLIDFLEPLDCDLVEQSVESRPRERRA